VKCSDLSRHGGDGLVHWEDRSLLSSFSAVTFEKGCGSLETCHDSCTPGIFHWRNWPWGFTVYVYLHTACLVCYYFYMKRCTKPSHSMAPNVTSCCRNATWIILVTWYIWTLRLWLITASSTELVTLQIGHKSRSIHFIQFKVNHRHCGR
jgi:hypothetical protein